MLVVWATYFPVSVEVPASSSEWPYLPALLRLVLALALGFFVGLERQRRGKDAGVRTFAFVGLIGCLGGLLGEIFAVVALALVGILVVLLAVQAARANHGTELTTAASLIVIGFTGVLCGQGHTLTPTAVGVLTAALLTWKESFVGLSVGLTETELRSAVLLAILAFVIYPALPPGAIDAWGLIELRAAWITVLLIAGIGFGNYILLKAFGETAVELTGFFGGLVNSTVTVTALALRVRTDASLISATYRGILLATAAMLTRNGILLAILSPQALATAVPALALMLATCVVLVLLSGRPVSPTADPGGVPLLSPFSLSSALKFGALFLALKVAGSVAQWWLGQLGFYLVSLAGGLISSASAVASAGALAAKGDLTPAVAGTGAVIAAIASALVNLPLVARIGRERPLTRRISLALGLVVIIGILTPLVGFLPREWRP